MSYPQKVLDFIDSQEFNQIVDDLTKFLNINQESDEYIYLFAFFTDWVKTNKKGKERKIMIKNYLSFLNEEKVNSFDNYLSQNFQSKIDGLWQEEKEIQEEAKETFGEKEKRYLELMKEILKRPPTLEAKPKKEVEGKKTITFVPEEEVEEIKEKPITWKKTSEPKPELPEGTVIIRKKEEGVKIEKNEDFLDLSNL